MLIHHNSVTVYKNSSGILWITRNQSSEQSVKKYAIGMGMRGTIVEDWETLSPKPIMGGFLVCLLSRTGKTAEIERLSYLNLTF